MFSSKIIKFVAVGALFAVNMQGCDKSSGDSPSDPIIAGSTTPKPQSTAASVTTAAASTQVGATPIDCNLCMADCKGQKDQCMISSDQPGRGSVCLSEACFRCECSVEKPIAFDPQLLLKSANDFYGKRMSTQEHQNVMLSIQSMDTKASTAEGAQQSTAPADTPQAVAALIGAIPPLATPAKARELQTGAVVGSASDAADQAFVCSTWCSNCAVAPLYANHATTLQYTARFPGSSNTCVASSMGKSDLFMSTGAFCAGEGMCKGCKCDASHIATTTTAAPVTTTATTTVTTTVATSTTSHVDCPATATAYCAATIQDKPGSVVFTKCVEEETAMCQAKNPSRRVEDVHV
jgi:hypothetical protein